MTAQSLLYGVGVLFSACVLDAFAAHYTARWTGSVEGSWHNPTNWDIGRVPDNVAGDTFDVELDQHPVVVQLAADVTVRNLTLATNVTLAGGTFDLTVAGNLDWSRGAMSGSGITTVFGSATLRPPSSFPVTNRVTLAARKLQLHGLTALRGTLEMVHGPGAGEQAQVRNMATGSFQLQSASGSQRGAILASPAPTDTEVENRGLFTTTAFGAWSMRGGIVNLGGTVRLGGTINFAPGAGVRQESGALEIGGVIPTVPAPGGVGKPGGILEVIRGSFYCAGSEVGTAIVGGTLPRQDAVLLLSFQGDSFGSLHLKSQGTLRVDLRESTTGFYGRMHILQSLVLEGSLDLRNDNPPGSPPFLNTDRFTFTTFEPAATLQGQFANAAFGQRFQIRDGTLLLEHVTSPNRALLARDFRPFSYELSGTTSSQTYVLFPTEEIGPDANGPVALHPEASLMEMETVNWEGGELSSELTAGYNSPDDQLLVRGPALQVTAGRIIFTGSPTPVDIGSATASGASLAFVFNANATTEIVQALIRGLHYFNAGCHPGSYVTGNEQFAERAMSMRLRDSEGIETVRSSSVTFPSLVNIRFQPSHLTLADENPEPLTRGTAHLIGRFSSGESFPLPNLEFEITSTGRSHVMIVGGRGSIFVQASQGLSGEERITATAGPFTAYLGVAVADDCPIGSLIMFLLMSFYGDYQPPTFAPAAEGNPPAPEVSLASFYAVESLLGQSGEGRRLRNLYWQHAAEVVRLHLENPPLLDQSSSVLLAFQPLLSKLLSGRGTDGVITQEMIDKLKTAWTSLEAVAGLELRAALQTERARFDGFEDFVSKNYSEWAGMLDLVIPAQPWIQISNPRQIESRFLVDANEAEGHNFSLWRSSDFQSWQRVPDVLVQTDGLTITLIDAQPLPAQPFYQVRAQAVIGLE